VRAAEGEGTERRHLVLLGPTASGKSALAMAVARELGGLEIVVVDSMQVYRGMDVGTATPSAEDQAEVPHHLLDLADPDEDFTVALFQEAFRAALAGIEARRNRALLVAGTGLHLRTVIDDLDVPGQYPAVRAELEAQPDTEALHRRLAQLDPVGAGRMEPSNRRRVLRALEVTLGSGRPFSGAGPGLESHPENRFDQVGVWLPRGLLAERIERRYEAQLAHGFLDEVVALRARPEGLSRTAQQAVGYRELLAHLDGEMTAQDAVALAVTRTRQLAVRQQKWFRRDPRIRWLAHRTEPQRLLPALLGDWSA
jgi:tRNA dimethylallyltransferase